MPGDATDLNTLIDRYLAELAKPGVLSVRPGYQVRNNWLTGRQAVVVTVRSKGERPAGQRLPTEIDGVPVDVRQASARKTMEIEQPERYAAELRLTPDTGAVPHFADERTLAGDHPAARASAHAMLAAVPKPELTYSAPLDVGLVSVTAPTTIHLSASPDAGWPMLRDFLAGTKETLTVGLYDFTSAHVLAAVRDATKGKTVRLVLDHPPKNPTADQTDATTAADLAEALGEDLTQAWALTRTDKIATAWIYPTAYHIKVAVRDGSSVWLSSGNWNNSNQPDISPMTDPADATEARHRDRDWHVVMDHPELATVFEAYLTNDLTVAQAHNNAHPPADPPLPTPKPGGERTPAFAQFFAGTTVTDTIRITPLLTPDPGVYAAAVKALIGSARHTLSMQFQYIELPKQVDATSQAFADLVTAVVDRQQAGVDVRIIMSEYEKAGYLEQLQAAGLDVVHSVRIQNNVHNKGVVVDGATVLISSQNWSTDGTLYNRDAGVVIENPTAAEYFQRIFDHDWDHLAAQRAQPD
ncbi:MAG TPA: phospholipase D-like domain-containing protein [Pseudonocardiaceae bacterium]|jgi:phosphatidylserine/phosphatidylglycerophosphate/cardiolipin synthase-like enzyme